MPNYQGLQAALPFEAESLKIEANRALRAAEELARSGDPLAHGAFIDAESLANSAADPELQMRAHQGHGRFLYNRKRFRAAREHLVIAERNAQVLGHEDLAAEFQVRIEAARIYESSNKALKAAFSNFMEAGTAGYPWNIRRDVWSSYKDELEAPEHRKAAHKLGSKEYFSRHLDAAKK